MTCVQSSLQDLAHVHKSTLPPKPTQFASSMHLGPILCWNNITMLRCWRLERRPAWALHSRRAASNVGHEGPDLFACRQRWFQRQVLTQTLIPVDLIPLAQRLPVQRTTHSQTPTDASSGRQAHYGADATTDAFLSCCTSPLCDNGQLRSIFAQLAADQQCAILCKSFTHSLHVQIPFLSECVEEALRSSAFVPAHWARVLASVRAADRVQRLPVAAILKNVFGGGRRAFTSLDDARVFIADALSLLESQHAPLSGIVECLEDCGLSYEAFAYASSPAAFLPFSFPPDGGEVDGRGYGALVGAMCALPRPPLRWFKSVRRAMPPALQRYSTLMLLHAAVRRSGGVVSVESEVWRLFAADLMSPLEVASALHFLLGEGNGLTAQLLLEHCHTQQQVLTLMQYTQGAPLSLTFQALEKVLTTRTGGRIITHLRLENRKRRTRLALLFEAQHDGEGSATTFTRRSEAHGLSGEAVLAGSLSVGFLDRGLIHQYLRDALPRSFVARGERSLSQMLTAIPPSAVEHVAQSLPTMHSDALSWWVSLYLKGGNVDGAFAVLAVIASRGCLPHMQVLVELLECAQDDSAQLVRSVTVVRQDFPTVAETVLRAFVERAASLMTRGAASAQSTAQAVHTLKSLAVMGLPRLSARCLSDMVARDASDAIHATVSLAQELSNAGQQSTDIVPLDVAALRGLAAAGQALKYHVSLSVVALSADGSIAGWWGSVSRPQRSLSRCAYAAQDLSLWPWVREEALSVSHPLSRDELHKAVRVVALGSRDPTATVAFWAALKGRLRDGQEESRVHQSTRGGVEDSEAYTLACVSAVCAAHGQRELASQVWQGACRNARLSPLLDALSLLHAAPLRDVDNEEAFKTALRLLNFARLQSRRRRHPKKDAQKEATSLLQLLPPSLRRVVRASGPEIVNAFHVLAPSTAVKDKRRTIKVRG